MEQLVMCFDEPERWLPVPDYEGMYEVSDFGRVRSLPRKYAGGRILKQSMSAGGLAVGLSRDGKGRTVRVHILVTRAFLGPCPEGQEVCHGPAGRLDNRLVNLSYGTHLKNCGEDMRRDGTIPAGVRNGRAILTDEIVLELRARVAAGESCRALAMELGVVDTSVMDAVAGTAWRHVAQPQPLPPAPGLSSRRRGRPRMRPIAGYEHLHEPPPPSSNTGQGAKQTVSFRWDEAMLRAAKLHAESRGLTVSDVVRLAVTGYLEANSDDAQVA